MGEVTQESIDAAEKAGVSAKLLKRTRAKLAEQQGGGGDQAVVALDMAGDDDTSPPPPPKPKEALGPVLGSTPKARLRPVMTG